MAAARCSTEGEAALDRSPERQDATFISAIFGLTAVIFLVSPVYQLGDSHYSMLLSESPYGMGLSGWTGTSLGRSALQSILATLRASPCPPISR
jgi:hypothetical protein